jgi:hypothetical protein
VLLEQDVRVVFSAGSGANVTASIGQVALVNSTVATFIKACSTQVMLP